MPRAVVCRELGPPESLRLETFEAASLAPGQARVAIRAAGLNFPDVLMAAGEYQLKPPLPFTPGMEAAGDVVEVNQASGVAVGDKDISQDSVLTEVCRKAGVDHIKFFEGIGQQAIKDQLKANTDEVIARGGFGSPTIFVGKTDMYFGNDRMPLIREALERLKVQAA